MTQAHISQALTLAVSSGNSTPRTSQVFSLTALATGPAARITQSHALTAYGPPAALTAESSHAAILLATSSGLTNVTSTISQAACLIAYFDGEPSTSRQTAWTYVMDGHRFYVLPLGPEGDWAYDTTTQEWCQLQTQGFSGLNFINGTMWQLRIIGGDSLYPYVYELDPTQSFDEGWRDIQRIVTGGIATRSRSAIGVANVILTASVGDDSATDHPISLAFSDDNGLTWSGEFDVPLTDESTQRLVWNALGSFSSPGRIFRFTDYAGPVRLDGADCTLTVGSGADVTQDQDGSVK
jgi:hypothetical protein